VRRFTSCPKPVARDSGRLARRAISAAGGVLHHLYFRRPQGIQRKERPRRFTAGLETLSVVFATAEISRGYAIVTTGISWGVHDCDSPN
jgi:hypothetical protein